MKAVNFKVQANLGTHQSHSQNGFSLVELLVAVLVLGVGILGVSGLQLVSLQNNRDALMRSDAQQMAYDILDRVRVNNVFVGVGDLPNPAANYATVGFDDAPSAGRNCVENSCTFEQMADFDLALWQCSLGAHNETSTCQDFREIGLLPAVDQQPGLPEGRGAISFGGGQVMQVRVQWTGFDGALQTVTVESQI